jgi:hypothetical protein
LVLGSVSSLNAVRNMNKLAFDLFIRKIYYQKKSLVSAPVAIVVVIVTNKAQIRKIDILLLYLAERIQHYNICVLLAYE